jgi:serine protease Do
VVTGVSENSPAAKAGLAGGDIITGFRGQRVEGTLELARLVRETPPGRVAKLTVWRDGRSRDISVEIGRAAGLLSGDLMPPDMRDRLRQFQERMQRRFEGRNAPPPRGGPVPGAPGTQGRQQQRGAPGAAVLGVTVQDVSGQLGAYLKVPEGQGVLITDVHAGSAAEKGGLQAGDVIIAVDGQRVHNTGELRARMRGTTATRTVALRVVRNGAETTVNVEVSAPSQPGAGARGLGTIPI